MMMYEKFDSESNRRYFFEPSTLVNYTFNMINRHRDSQK